MVIRKKRLVIGVVEQVELQFARDIASEPFLCKRFKLTLEHRPRRFFDQASIVMQEIANDQGAPFLPRQRAKRGEIGPHLKVAEALLPIREIEAAHRLHINIHSQQVIAGMSPMRGHLFQKELARKAFADKPAEDVGESNNDGINFAATDFRFQRGESHRTAFIR